MDKAGSEGSNSRMLDQRQIFVPDGPVPRVSVLSLSVIAHVAVLVLIGVRHATAPQIVPTKYEMVQTISGVEQVTYNPPPKPLAPLSTELDATAVLFSIRVRFSVALPFAM